MKRAEIEQKVAQIIAFNKTPVSHLTELFIQLSNERCKEQKDICADIAHDETGLDRISDTVLDAPLPEIK